MVLLDYDETALTHGWIEFEAIADPTEVSEFMEMSLHAQLA